MAPANILTPFFIHKVSTFTSDLVLAHLRRAINLCTYLCTFKFEFLLAHIVMYRHIFFYIPASPVVADSAVTIQNGTFSWGSDDMADTLQEYVDKKNFKNKEILILNCFAVFGSCSKPSYH